MNARSSVSPCSRSRPTRPNRRTGSCPVTSQVAGSTQRNRSRVRSSHDQRRFMASSCIGARASGSLALTVKLRRALISRTTVVATETAGFRTPVTRGRQQDVIGRIVIDDVRPRTPHPEHAAKAVVGERVEISADVFRDGHDILAVQVRWRPAANGTGKGKSGKWQTVRLQPLANDRWSATIEPTTLGMHEVVIEAWTDRYGTWRHKAEVKLAAGQDIDLELEEGARLMEGRAGLGNVVAALRDASLPVEKRLGPALDDAAEEAMAGPEGATDLTASDPVPLWVDRERALVGGWYELFPRSEGGFEGTLERLPAVAAMGFDIVYFPPVHPIGRSHRKGRNNTLEAGPDDPGSPWAIGGPEGGHLDIAPELGTLDDFRAVVAKAHELGMEIALDYALQCSPDHPWVHDHPEWFHHRLDGSIAYAE